MKGLFTLANNLNNEIKGRDFMSNLTRREFIKTASMAVLAMFYVTLERM